MCGRRRRLASRAAAATVKLNGYERDERKTTMITMSAVWDRTSEFLSDNLATVTAISLLTIYVSSLALEIISLERAAAEPGMQLIWSLSGLAAVALNLFGQIGVTALAIEPALGRAGAFDTARRRLLPVIGMGLVLLVGLLALCSPIMVLLVAGGADLSQLSNGHVPNLSPAGGLGIALYVLVLLPILLWLLARLSVVGLPPFIAVGALVVAERRGLGAIVHGFRMTRGLAARIVGVLILYVVISFVAGLAAKTVFGSIFRIAFGSGPDLTAAAVLTALVVAIVSTIFTVIAAAFVAKLYLAVRDRSDMVPAAA